MPKFENTVRMLAASWVPERSASKLPRWLWGTGGGWAASRPAEAASAAATSPRAQAGARGAPSALLGSMESNADFDSPRRVEPGGVEQRAEVRGRVSGIEGAAGAVEHVSPAAVAGGAEVAGVEHVEDSREQRGVQVGELRPPLAAQVEQERRGLAAGVGLEPVREPGRERGRV